MGSEASEASYVYILNGQKLIQKWSILASFWKPEACGQTVLPDRSILIGQKLMENAKIEKFKCDILGDFSNTVLLPPNSNMDEKKPTLSRLSFILFLPFF